MEEPQIATKKPVEVQFFQFTEKTLASILEWGGGAIVEVGAVVPEAGEVTVLVVTTLEGRVVAQRGDYIVKGSEVGEFWPVRQDIFEKTYHKKPVYTPRDSGITVTTLASSTLEPELPKYTGARPAKGL